MEKERTVGIKIFGWFLIVSSFLNLIRVYKFITLGLKLYYASSGLPENIGFISKSSVFSILIASVVFFFFLITGIGILKLKRWAYYAALLIPFMYFAGIIGTIQLLGLQSIMKPSLVPTLLISVIILLFLMRKNIVEQFNTYYITKRGKKLNPKEVILWLSIILVLWNVSHWFSVYVSYKHQLPIIKPRKMEYRIQDKSFILNNCERREVFDYNIYIPKEWKISNISMGDSSLGWNLMFINKEGSNLKSLVILDSKAIGELMLPLSKVLNFDSLYDFEKAIHYPNWSPIFRILKKIDNLNLKNIDDANTPAWKGFVKVIKVRDRNIYESSLYSLRSNKSCGVTVLFKDGAMTPEQAKSIIASLEFSAIKSKSETLFEKGKTDLANADFTSAAINFMNALYIDESNPEYACQLAQSLLDDNGIIGREARLNAAKKFLDYTLKLNPNYQKAKELSAMVDKEIQKIKPNKNKEE
jgi:hypothetical protein